MPPSPNCAQICASQAAVHLTTWLFLCILPDDVPPTPSFQPLCPAGHTIWPHHRPPRCDSAQRTAQRLRRCSCAYLRGLRGKRRLGRVVAGHLTQSLAYRVSVPVLLQSLYHFRRVWYTSYYYSNEDIFSTHYAVRNTVMTIAFSNTVRAERSEDRHRMTPTGVLEQYTTAALNDKNVG